MTSQHSYTVLFSAGEASGDQHAANMFIELLKLHPNIHGIGMGGSKMAESGIDLQFDSSGIGVIGLIEIIKHYPEIRTALKTIKQVIIQEKPDLLVCVDYKEFNLKLAQFAKKNGVKVLFYVSPQVWAWRAGRVVTYGKAIDMMAVIFPFETKFYQEKNIPVRYVGHPSLDKVIPLQTKEDDFKAYNLDVNRPVVGIMPGSRNNEIKRILPIMLAAAAELHKKTAGIQFILAQADSIREETLNAYLNNYSQLGIRVIKHQTYDVIQCCDAIMTTSGTASLEIALLEIPMVIAYRLSPLSYWIGKQLVKIPFIGLPNIIFGNLIVKELIQNTLTTNNLTMEIEQLLFDKTYRLNCIDNLKQVKTLLGQAGGSKNMAKLAFEMLTT